MGGGILTFTAPSSAHPRPAGAAAFLRQSVPLFSPPHDSFPQLLPFSSASKSCNGRKISRRKGNLSVNALNHSLSSNWEVSNYAAPSWLPRFEELDTTNMLLRQRIIFLGAQVLALLLFPSSRLQVFN